MANVCAKMTVITNLKIDKPMTDQITKEMAVDMLMSASPNYDLFDHPVISQLGRYIGGFVDAWDWDRAEIEKLPKDKIITIYHLCKNSFKKSNG